MRYGRAVNPMSATKLGNLTMEGSGTAFCASDGAIRV
jgi:hypothetical protein